VTDPGSFERIDKIVDAAFEPLRGRESVDRVATAFSNLSDYGLIWVLLALVKMRSKGPRRRRAILALGGAGFSSLFVSRMVKQAVARDRPEEHLDASVRTPTSSSFPSGHTLAAFCTAVVLPETEAGTTAAVGFATAVAASRVHLRAHHPTDVVGGAAIGSALGLLVRAVIAIITPGTKRRRQAHRRRKGPKGMDGTDYLLTQL
jgi:undecaprenyl-diphosphatase